MDKKYYFVLPSLVMAIGSVILAYNKVDCWGWFLLAAVAVFVYPSEKNDDTKTDPKSS